MDGYVGAVTGSLASRLNTQPPVIQFIRRLARQAGRFDIIDDDDDSDSVSALGLLLAKSF